MGFAKRLPNEVEPGCLFRQSSMATFASIRFLNHCIPRHSSRNFPLKLSFAPFCQGFPGSIGAVSMPASLGHFSRALDTNSGPLSVSGA